MKKHIHKMFALILVCALFSSLFLTVSATEVDTYVTSSSEEIQKRYEIFDKITVNRVQYELVSNVSGKNFATYNHEGREIQFEGKLTHTTSTSDDIIVGLCHPVAPYGAFAKEQSKKYKSGASLDFTAEVSSLPTDNNYPNAQTYYVFVTNDASSGTISGYIHVFSAPL